MHSRSNLGPFFSIVNKAGWRCLLWDFLINRACVVFLGGGLSDPVDPGAGVIEYGAYVTLFGFS